jgi:rhomboid protease GluP
MVLGLNLILSLTPGIDAWGHLGGFLAGLASALIFGPQLEVVSKAEGVRSIVDHRPWTLGRWRAAGLGAIVLVVAMGIVRSGQW